MEHTSPLLELVQAYRVVFQVEGPLASDWLTSFTRQDLKAAFRRSALQHHPDRAQTLGEDRGDLHERFVALTAAYERLGGLLERRRPTPKAAPPRPRSRRQHPRAGWRRVDHYYSGRIPRRSLLLGEFLYYSGAVSWRAFTDAIAWQRGQRPLVGEIAVQLGYLTAEGVSEILVQRRRQRRIFERFVRFARGEGYLTPFGRAVLLGRQRQLQRPLGEFFVDRGLLAAGELSRLVDDALRHSARFDPIR